MHLVSENKPGVDEHDAYVAWLATQPANQRVGIALHDMRLHAGFETPEKLADALNKIKPGDATKRIKGIQRWPEITAQDISDYENGTRQIPRPQDSNDRNLHFDLSLCLKGSASLLLNTEIFPATTMQPDPHPYEQSGLLCAAIRIREKLTRKQLGEAMGFGSSFDYQINMLEHGKRKPDVESLAQGLHAYGKELKPGDRAQLQQMEQTPHAANEAERPLLLPPEWIDQQPAKDRLRILLKTAQIRQRPLGTNAMTNGFLAEAMGASSVTVDSWAKGAGAMNASKLKISPPGKQSLQNALSLSEQEAGLFKGAIVSFGNPHAVIDEAPAFSKITPFPQEHIAVSFSPPKRGHRTSGRHTLRPPAVLPSQADFLEVGELIRQWRGETPLELFAERVEHALVPDLHFLERQNSLQMICS